MRSSLLAALLACVAIPLLAAEGAGSPRGLFVRATSPGAPAETTWIDAGGNGVRVLAAGAGVRVAPVSTSPTGRYIVRLAEPALPAPLAARAAARRALDERFTGELARREPGRFGASGPAGVRVVEEYDHLLTGVAVEAPPGWLERLRAMPGVAAVEEDRPVHATLDQSVHQVRGDLVRTLLGGTGRGVRVGIIDTGVDYHHPAFGGGFGPGTRVAGGDDLVNHDGDPMDDNGHGTHVAGIVAGNGGDVIGMAIEATLYAYKVLDANGSGFVSTVIAGLERCADPDQDPSTDDHLDVVNMSLGGYGGSPDDAICRAVDALDSLGTLVVTAAGNAGVLFSILEPAIARGAIAVGAASRADTTIYFSSRGPGPDFAPKPDLLAPGDAIVSAALGGGRVAMSGTSMAAPHVAGAAAMLLQLHRDWTHEEARAALTEGARDVGRPVYEQGAGLLDAFAAATANVFAIPSRLAFGRVQPGGPDTTLERTLRVHSHGVVSMTATLRVRPEHETPGVDVSVDPAQVLVPAGGEASALVRVALRASRPANRESPFEAEGVIEVQLGDETRRVPYSVHDCFQFRATNAGGDVVGVVHDADRVWPTMGPLGSSWVLPPGDYDVMAFSGGDLDVPFLLMPGVHLVSDTVLDMGRGFPDRTLDFALVDESSRPRRPSHMDVLFKHRSGASLGWINALSVPAIRLPEAGPDYRLEWAAWDDDGAVRYDIPGTAQGPFEDGAIANDPAAIRRSTERYAVSPGDSLLPLEFRLHPDGLGGYFGFTSIDITAPLILEPYEITHWRAATPYPVHWRYGRWDLQVRRSVLLGGPGEFVAAVAPLLSLDHGDTVGIHPHWLTERSVMDLTGRRFAFGFGPSFYNADIAFNGTTLLMTPSPGQSGRLFADGLGTKRHGPPTRYELVRGDDVIARDTIPDEDVVESLLMTQIAIPPSLAPGWTVRILAPEAHVLDTASHTTVSTTVAGTSQNLSTPQLLSFAVVASGGVAEEVRFGQDRDPHVEFTAAPPIHAPYATVAAELDARADTTGPWTALAVHQDGLRFRAALAPMAGQVSLRLRLSTLDLGILQMDVEPAFVARPSPAIGARVLQTSADARTARVDWRVPGVDGALVVERSEPGGDWAEWGEANAANGVAHFEDTAVVPGKRYGYRLASASAVAWVQIPIGTPRLSLAIAPNPARGDLLLAIGVDRTAPIRLTLLDVQGRAVRTRVLDGLAPGVHVVSVTPAEHVRPGLYFVRLERGADVITRRVTLLQ